MPIRAMSVISSHKSLVSMNPACHKKPRFPGSYLSGF
jgi:hypothetical protein